MSKTTLYERLGGYDAISAVANDLLPRLQTDARLARYWQHRGENGVRREKQLLVDFLCWSAGGPLYYTGRDMKTSHKGMKISEEDWSAFLGTSMTLWRLLKFLRLNVTRWWPSYRARNQTSSKYRYEAHKYL
jgi:hemoglobin